MKLQIDYPNNCKTKEKKEKFLLSNIDDEYSKLTTAEKAGVKRVTQMGTYLLALKKIRKKKGKKKFKKYLKKHLPHVGFLEAKRYMKITKKMDLDVFPNMAFLGLGRIQDLAVLVGKEKIATVLLMSHVDLKINARSKDSVRTLKESTDKTIAKLKEEKGSAEGDDKKKLPDSKNVAPVESHSDDGNDSDGTFYDFEEEDDEEKRKTKIIEKKFYKALNNITSLSEEVLHKDRIIMHLDLSKIEELESRVERLKDRYLLVGY